MAGFRVFVAGLLFLLLLFVAFRGGRGDAGINDFIPSIGRDSMCLLCACVGIPGLELRTR